MRWLQWSANNLLQCLAFPPRYAQIRNPRGVLHARCMHAAGEEQWLGVQFPMHALSPVTSRYTKPDCRDREIRPLEHHIHNHTVTRALRLLSSKGQRPFALYVFFDVRLPSTFHAPQQTPSVHLPRFRFIPFTPRMVTIRGKNATARSRSKPPGCDFE